MNFSCSRTGSNTRKRWFILWVFAWLGISTIWAVDTDGDGYSDADENRYDWNASLVDQRIRGGISKTESALIGVSMGSGGGLVKVSSDPPGMIYEYSTGLGAGKSHLTATIDPINGDKRFLYWERNGQIVRGPGGVPNPEVNEEDASQGIQLTAKFLDATEDLDGDGLEDWFEKKVQDISLNNSDDPDGDGYTLLEEQENGFSPFLRDTRRRGGTSSSRGGVTSVTLGNGGVLEVGSDPPGLIDAVSLPMSNQQSYSTVVVDPKVGTQRFLYWERDGVILRGPGGVPLQRYTETDIGWGRTLTAKFIHQNTNTDGGLPDWVEMRVGGLNTKQTDDPDGDGYILQIEHKRGFSVFLADTRRRGGYSKSSSGMLTIHAPNDVPEPPSPPDADGDGIADAFDLDTDGDGSTDEEELSNGTDPWDVQSFTLDQQFALEDVLKVDFSQNLVTPLQSNGWEGLASSVDGPAPVSGSFSGFHAVDGSIEITVSGQTHWRDYAAVNQGPHNSMTNLLSDVVFCNNGGTIALTLKDLKPGRYRMKTYHHLSEDYGDTKFDIRVTDAEGNGTLVHSNVTTSQGTNPQNLSVREFSFLVNQNSDDVNVSIGPGGDITNHMGINGFELGSYLTENPTSIDLSNNQVMENQVIGTVVGQFSGTDPDPGAILSFRLIPGAGAIHNSLLSIDNNGTLQTAAVLDRETISNLFVRVEVADEFGATLEKIFTVNVTDDPVEDNTAPHEISLSPLTVSEIISVGDKVADFNALDIDFNASLRFELIEGNGSLHNGHFQLDRNGSLFLASPLDFETNQTMSIRTVVIDEYNGSLEGNFSLQVLDVFEDFDGDGTEDHLDEDEDGDGFSNIIELAYPSDPRDPNSVANTAPVSIMFVGGNATLYENSANATMISQLTAVDPDPNDTLSYSLVQGVGSYNNAFFQLSTDGLLRSGVVFDFETYEQNQTIRVRVEDQHGAYFESNMTVRLLNIVEDLDGDGIEDHYDLDDDGDGFSDLVEIAYPSDPRDAGSVANVPPDHLWVAGNSNLSIAENEANGSMVGILSASDPDANTTLSFSLVEGNGSTGNNYFTLEANGTLRIVSSLNYEESQSVYSIRVRVSDEHNFSLEDSFLVNLINLNEYPSKPFTSDALNFIENNLPGAEIVRFESSDQDLNSSLVFDLPEHNGTDFSIDTNGTLYAVRPFDFETDDSNFSIIIRVTDEGNLSSQSEILIHLLNAVEDLDGDGVEDHYDPDDDGDGFSDLEEIAYPSDPRDAGSVANVPPNHLWVTGDLNLSIAENEANGSVLGILSASDPDTNATLTIKLSEDANRSFSINQSGYLQTLVVFDFETSPQIVPIKIIVYDEHNASLEKVFNIEILNVVEDLDGDGIEDHYDLDDDGDGFSDIVEIAYPSDPRDPHSLANAPPSSPVTVEDTRIDENMPIGSIVARFSSFDPDGDDIIFKVFDGNSPDTSNYFEFDSAGNLKTLMIFDFEQTDLYSVRIRAFDGVEYSESIIFVQVNDLDEIHPVITINGEEIIFHPTENTFSDPGAVWSDDVDGEGNLTALGSVNTKLPGTYELTYLFSDRAGNPADVRTRKVVVVDQSHPMIAIRGPETLDHGLWLPFKDPGVEAFDAVDGNLTSEIVISGSVDVEKPGTYRLEYSVSDRAGNKSDILSREIIIQNSPPISIELTHAKIEENSPIGTEVGGLVIIDPDDPLLKRSYDMQISGVDTSEELPFLIDENATLRVANELDFEQRNEYSISIKVADEFGGTIEKDFIIRVTDAFLPIIRTGEHRVTEEEVHLFTGKVLDPGAMAGLQEMGVLVSEKPDPLLHDSKSVKIATFSRNDTFLVKAKLNMGNGDFYYRSYAINGEGSAYGASEKISMGNRGRGNQFVGWADAFQLGAGEQWLYSPWFGSFYATGNYKKAWIFHADFGWIYVHEEARGGIWLWLEENGWVWTSKRIFPRAFISASKKWILLLSEELVENTLDGDFTGNTNAQDEISKFTNLDAEYLEDGWWASPWFGNFHYNEITKQVTHEEFGKISIIPGEGKNDIWVWFQSLNWVWTSSEFYPFIYKNDDLSWYFLHGSSSHMIVLFDYLSDSWMEIPKLK